MNLEKILNEEWAQKIQASNEDERTLKVLRIWRNTILSDTDWTQLSDSPLSDSAKLEWAEYRQQLRDITKTYKTIDLPEQPNGEA